MKMTQLSVSSAILAAVLSGCSQQQVGGSQVSAGSQQSSGSQVSSSQQVAGGTQVGATSQQQVENARPVVRANVYKPAKNNVARVHRKKPRPAHSVRNSGLPAAQPGQCFARVKLPATYKTQSRRILIQKATARRVLVRAPQYRWLNKKVLVRKQAYRTRIIPAQYKTVSNRVMIKPAYNTWRKGHGAITRIDNMTGEIMCRVKIPAVYKTVKKRVLVRPSQTLRTLVPAAFKTVKHKQRISPALYKTVRTPARYKTQNYRVKTGGARYVWRAVLCKTNAPKNYRKHSATSSRKYQKVASNKTHRVAPSNYRKAATKQYKKAPKNYRKATVVRRPVVRTNNYKAQYNNGVNYQDYLKVMNTGKRYASNPYKGNKSTKVNRKVSYSKTVNLKKRVKANKQSKADTRRGIVYNIQKALTAKGFDPGTMNGKMDAGTAAALKAFQSSRGLPVGKLSKDTFRALGMIR